MSKKIVRESLNEELFLTLRNFNTGREWRPIVDVVEIYKNPVSIKRMNGNLRAISDDKFNIYVVDVKDENILHSDLLNILEKKDYTIVPIVYWQQYYKTNIFYLSEEWPASEDVEDVKIYTGVLRTKFPQYKFVNHMTIFDRQYSEQEDKEYMNHHLEDIKVENNFDFDGDELIINQQP